MTAPATTARCRSCGAEIIWAKTMAGKAMPLQPRPTFDGNVTLQADLLGDTVAVVHHTPPLDEDRWLPHWAVCPQADQWRRR